MKFFKLSLITFTLAAFLLGCNRMNETSSVNPNRADTAQRENITGDNPCAARENSDNDSRLSLVDCDASSYFARENLDLQAVGHLLEKANNAEEFEHLLNSTKGVNNLDLNGDGYADYISVAEYDNSDDNQRGFTLFDRFGAEEIQEIARIIFDRTRLDAPGARILLNGNEQLYGDNYYYETDWQDKSLAIAKWAFARRGNNYQSPYYYENYPNNYEAYQIVETPVYRTRIKEYYPAPVFIKAVEPMITQIKIKSPYTGKSAQKIFAKLAKPTKEQLDFKKNNPNKPEFVIVKNDKKKEFQSDDKNDKKERNSDDFEKSRNENNDRFENRNKSDKPNKEDRKNIKADKSNGFERENEKPNKPKKAEKQKNDGQNRGNGKGGGKGKKN